MNDFVGGFELNRFRGRWFNRFSIIVNYSCVTLTSSHKLDSQPQDGFGAGHHSGLKPLGHYITSIHLIIIDE
jgi:hypothetical protein